MHACSTPNLKGVIVKKKEFVPRATSPRASAAVPPPTLALRGSVVAGGALALRAEPPRMPARLGGRSDL